VGGKTFDTTSCDIIKAMLPAVTIAMLPAAPGTLASITIGHETFTAPDPRQVTGAARKDAIAALGNPHKPAVAAKAAEGDKPAVEAKPAVVGALEKVGYPTKADPARTPLVILLLWYLVLLVTMVYGPIAAMLVELFPSRIRYSSMSLPYHIGNGWLGGLLPAIGFAMVAANGNIYYGLWYPVIVAAFTAVVGLVILPETYKNNIDD
jgi:hypothetical protein